MKNKIFYLVLFFSFCFIFSSHSQRKSKEKIKALKIAYITERLELTSEEAQDFWPIYNDYNNKQNEIKIKNREAIKKLLNTRGHIDSIKAEEAKNAIFLNLKNDKVLNKLKTDFISKMKDIIPYNKILKLQIVEMEFNKKLMRRYKNDGYKKGK